MDVKHAGTWIGCESRGDLESRLTKLVGPMLDLVVTEDASSWGYMVADGFIVPLGFANLGIEPQAALLDGRAAIGVGKYVVGADLRNSKPIFVYRMPTVFHEFINVDERGFLIKDETGFVWLSPEGKELWVSCIDDIVERFSVSGDEISGETFEGKSFVVRIPGFA